MSRRRVIRILFFLALLLYFLISFLVFLPQCLVVWNPAGVNEFVFCFILPPITVVTVYILYRIKSLIISLISLFITLLILIAWFGPDYFIYYFTHSRPIFWDCVQLLHVFSNVFGVSYETINVLLFCILGPVVFIIMLFIIVMQNKKINSYRLR